MTSLESLPDQWDKRATAYAKSHPITNGSAPKDITPDQQNGANLCGAIRECAYELRQALKDSAK